MPYSPWPHQKCLSFSKVRKSKVDQSHITAKRKWQQSLVFRKGYIAWKNVRGLKAFERQKSSTHLNFSLSDRNSCQIYIQLLFLPFSDSETGLIEISLRKRKKGQTVSIKQWYCVMWQKRRAEELSWKSVVNVLNIVLLSLSAGQSNFTLMTILLPRHFLNGKQCC